MPKRIPHEDLVDVCALMRRCLDAKAPDRERLLTELKLAWHAARPELEADTDAFLTLRAFVVAMALVEHRTVENTHDLVQRFVVADRARKSDIHLITLKSVFLSHCSLFAAVYIEATEEE